MTFCVLLERAEASCEEFDTTVPDGTVYADGAAGATLYRDGKIREIAAHPATQLDPTGAGDVFAAAFFVMLHRTGNAEWAGRIAAQLAAGSVTRRGLAGVPSASEVEQALRAVRA